MTEWVEQRVGIFDPPLRVGIELSPEGLRYVPSMGRLCQASWDQVFGVALIPEEQPERLFVLVPRKPPDPPWFEVTESMLAEADKAGGLGALAARVRERSQQSGYRDRGPSRPLMSAEQLMERILARAEVPGALEVPVGAGPGGWWRRSLDLFAAGSAGGLFGLYGGAFTGSAALALCVAAAGAVAGASIPVLVASNWRSVRRRSKKPRVLVLAPDGCVVGLPTGPRAFSWASIGRFSKGAIPPRDRPSAPPRDCLEIALRDGTVAGAIDGAWFAEPLELIVAVAEAYRKRWTSPNR